MTRSEYAALSPKERTVADLRRVWIGRRPWWKEFEYQAMANVLDAIGCAWRTK